MLGSPRVSRAICLGWLPCPDLFQRQCDSNFDFLELPPPVVIMLAIKVCQALRELGGDFE